jgi:hypothetical protein
MMLRLSSGSFTARMALRMASEVGTVDMAHSAAIIGQIQGFRLPER